MGISAHAAPTSWNVPPTLLSRSPVVPVLDIQDRAFAESASCAQVILGSSLLPKIEWIERETESNGISTGTCIRLKGSSEWVTWSQTMA